MSLKTKIPDNANSTEELGANNKNSNTIGASIDELPVILPVLNLSSSLLMPQSQLPLGMSSDSFIAALPELMDGKVVAVIPLSLRTDVDEVGCVGKIQDVQFSNDEAKLVIQGVCRFNVLEKFPNRNTPLQHVRVSYDKYKNDLNQNADVSNRGQLLSAIETYFKKFSIDRDWSFMKETPSNVLVSAITMAFPFHPLEKQSLLETVDVEEQCNMIIKIIEMDSYNHSLTSIKTIN